LSEDTEQNSVIITDAILSLLYVEHGFNGNESKQYILIGDDHKSTGLGLFYHTNY
jgi:hypothetical protein